MICYVKIICDSLLSFSFIESWALIEIIVILIKYMFVYSIFNDNVFWALFLSSGYVTNNKKPLLLFMSNHAGHLQSCYCAPSSHQVFAPGCIVSECR